MSLIKYGGSLHVITGARGEGCSSGCDTMISGGDTVNLNNVLIQPLDAMCTNNDKNALVVCRQTEFHTNNNRSTHQLMNTCLLTQSRVQHSPYARRQPETISHMLHNVHDVRPILSVQYQSGQQRDRSCVATNIRGGISLHCSKSASSELCFYIGC